MSKDNNKIIRQKLQELSGKLDGMQHLVVLGSNEHEQNISIMIGDPDNVIGMLGAGLIVAVNSIYDPKYKLMVRQMLSTRIMTEDIDYKRIADLFGPGKQ